MTKNQDAFADAFAVAQPWGGDAYKAWALARDEVANVLMRLNLATFDRNRFINRACDISKSKVLGGTA